MALLRNGYLNNKETSIQKVNGLILAAGLSSRMGEFKLLMQMEGETLIENSINSMLRAAVNEVTVVLGFRADEVKSVLQGKYSDDRVKFVYNDHYASTDMLHSTKIGVAAIGNCDAFFLLPGDMPAIGKNTYLTVISTMRKTKAKVAFPTLSGIKKHPPLISAECINDILGHNSEGGLRTLWEKYTDNTATVEVNDIGCMMDNDTLGDYVRCIRHMGKTRTSRLSASAGALLREVG